MTLLVNVEKRRARNGRGLVPPNPKQWELEHNGLDLGERLGIPLDSRLYHESAFELVPNATVFRHGDLPVAKMYVDHFRGVGARSWSGMAIDLGSDGVLVVYNDSHPHCRVRATLMEEFFHLWLGHPASVLRYYRDDLARSYNKAVENEAYGSGAAALVPYRSLRARIEAAQSVANIAEHFDVSRDLVTFRMKVTKLYHFAKRNGSE
jgi:uncharacterized protein DUF955